MTDERKDEAPAASAEEWPKRAGPTIDLDASEVSGDTRKGSAFSRFFNHARERLTGDRGWSGLFAGLGGAIAALLVFAGLWATGMVGQQPAAAVSPTQFDNVAANVGDLTARLARVEANAGKAAAPANDPSLAGRIDGLEKAVAAAREEATALRENLRTMITQLNNLKAAPRDGSTPVDLAPLDERLTRLEQAIKALTAEQAKPAPASADDINVRRLVVANTLEHAVRRGDAYATVLAAAKQVATNPAALSPLDPFAAKGIPSEASFLRDIVPVLQRIADAGAKQAGGSAATSPAAGGVLDRLQAGLAKFVRVERDTGQPAARDVPPAQASIRRDDLAAARQDIAKLPQAADPQVQAWIKAVDAREAALAAAQKFSSEALAMVSKSGQ